MVAGHDQHGHAQPGEERARGLELAPVRSLRQIAGNGDEIRADRADALDERRDDSLVEPSEVQVGEMNDRPHRVQEPGVSTCSAPGHDRQWNGGVMASSSPSQATLMADADGVSSQSSVDESEASACSRRARPNSA